ncbi:hemerythrin domain-containing protein [Kitasatospora sp. NPDC101176]|uniref:hemerythrin domain-containing protein n=1 Tax=Kitasatospora sp. NPDC101176 TaxID=3364099 RepID=UPI0038255138
MASRDGDRVVALSRQLSHAHRELRRQINEIRTHPGHHRTSEDTLLAHCLAFCTALTSHHQGEDDHMFSQLLRQRPDLATTVANLVEDHGMIASILSRVRELAARAGESRGPALEAVRRELDGLAAIMESHFSYEERTISEALDDGPPDPDWTDTVFRFGRA